ncbi:LysR family transcriptional regulator [Sandarakinorhabdus sp.]|uniref:LysR family transcriptional regulator n=1 Tax=Sandarakinorhabdus sp. TaxID=1916663 RepID=UPI00286D998E|nr:LysR family transcriptional regulator [Sandarakinorhabdus sp.]
MEMQQVRYFLSVARTLNFTRAAEDCNVTQPALTRAIKQLEDELGGELIRREGRLSHLTDLGNRMLPLLQQCFDAALAAKSVAAKVKKGEVPTLTLAVSRSLDLAYLMRALREMHRSFAGFQLKLRRGTGAQIAAMLKNGEVELAIGGPMGESWERLETWPMFSEAFDLVVGVDHPLAMRNDLDLNVELIRDQRFLVQAGTDIAEFETERLCAAGITLDNAHEVDSDRDLEALVIAEFGVAIMPASAMNAVRIRHLSCSGLDLRRTVAIYSVAGRARSREASALLTLVRSADWSSRLTADTAEHV